MIQEPSNRFDPMSCPHNTPQQQQNAQTEQMNNIMQTLGAVASSPYFQYMIAPSSNDSPMVSTGKYLLSGAINMYQRSNNNNIGSNNRGFF